MATALGHTQVIPVLDRLDTAHTATIEWLEERLGEVGRTGTSALRATPLQNAVAATRRTVGAPYLLTAATVNRISSLLRRGAGRTSDAAQDAAGSVVQTAERATGAAHEVTDSAAQAVEEASAEAEDRVIDLTDVDEEHEPFAAYGKLTGDSIMRHVADSQDAEHVREILAYEQAHKNRKGVVQASTERLAEL